MLVDTSGLLCLFNAADPQHQSAVDAYGRTAVRFTHNYVLAEFVALANARRLPRGPAIDFVDAIARDTDCEVIWVDQSLHHRAIDLLQHRRDKSYSLCDAVSFVLMRDRTMDIALTTDSHFSQEGFRRLLAS